MFDPGHRTERRPPFRFAAYTRVAFSDTDAQGVVYYGRYLPYFDLARTEYHRELGGAGRAEFVVRASDVARIGRTSVTYEYAAYRVGPGDEEALMVIAAQTLVLIDHDDRTTLPVPDGFRAAVSELEGSAS